MNPFITILICTLYFTSAFSQKSAQTKNTLQNGGTFIIAAICKDGIVIGADSRSVFYNPKHEIIAYTDTSRKLFKVQNLVIGNAGLYSFDNLQFDGLLEDFQATTKLKYTVNNFYSYFENYLKKKISDQTYQLFLKKNSLFVCGYDKNKPVINVYENKELITTRIGYISSEKALRDIKNSQMLFTNFNLPTSIKIVNDLISNYEFKGNKFGESGIGGPNCIFYINEKHTTENTKIKFKSFLSIKNFAKLCLDGKIKILYRTKNDSIIFHNEIKNINKI